MIVLKYNPQTGEATLDSKVVGNTRTPSGCALLWPFINLPVGMAFVPQQLHDDLIGIKEPSYALYHPSIPEWTRFHPPLLATEAARAARKIAQSDEGEETKL